MKTAFLPDSCAHGFEGGSVPNCQGLHSGNPGWKSCHHLSGVVVQAPHTLFEDRDSYDPGACLGWVGWPVRLRGQPVSTSLAVCFQARDIRDIQKPLGSGACTRVLVLVSQPPYLGANFPAQ